MDHPALAVDYHQVAVFSPCNEPGEAADSGDAHGAGDDGSVGAGPGFFQRNARKLRVAVFEQFGRADAAGDKNGPGRGDAATAIITVELAQEAVFEVFKVVQAFAQKAVAGVFEASAVFAANAVDGGFR
jgi:hypothetical protein